MDYIDLANYLSEIAQRPEGNYRANLVFSSSILITWALKVRNYLDIFCQNPQYLWHILLQKAVF
jgi:hypothetical protein